MPSRSTICPEAAPVHCGFCQSAPCECPPPDYDDDIPLLLRQEFHRCATANGRISYGDTGLWSDANEEAMGQVLASVRRWSDSSRTVMRSRPPSNASAVNDVMR